MKKSLLLLAAAAIVVGCSKNGILNEIEQSEVLIGFGDSYVGKKVKSGEVTNLEDLQTNNGTMKVWGWKTHGTTSQIFDNQQVTYNSSSSRTNTKWEYTPLKYWDMEATNYKFYAVSPFTSKFAINATTRIISGTGIEGVQVLDNKNGASAVTSDNTEAIDYLVAAVVDKAPKGNDPDDGDVTFTFSHILSKLIVNVKTTTNFINEGNNYPQIKLTDLSIKLAGMCPNYTQAATGVVNPSADTWNGTAMAEASYVCFDVAGDVTDLLLTGTAQKVASYLVAPTATAGTTYTYKVSVEYDIYYGASDHEHFTATDKTVSTLTSFAQNTSNTLTITIDPQVIYFDVTTVTDRTAGSEGTVTVQ